jgi:hypothetical protein
MTSSNKDSIKTCKSENRKVSSRGLAKFTRPVRKLEKGLLLGLILALFLSFFLGFELVSGYPELAVLTQLIFSFRLLLLGLLLGIKRTNLVLVVRLERCRVLNIRHAQRRTDRYEMFSTPLDQICNVF